MSYQLYRNTTLGNTLQESLDELIQVCSQKYIILRLMLSINQFYFCHHANYRK